MEGRYNEGLELKGNLNEVFGNVKIINLFSLNEFVNKKEDFILKKGFSSRGEKMVFGFECTNKEWESLLREFSREGGRVIHKRLKIDKHLFKRFNQRWRVEAKETILISCLFI